MVLSRGTDPRASLCRPLIQRHIPFAYQFRAASFLVAARFFRLVRPYHRQHVHPVHLISRSPGIEPYFLWYAYIGCEAVVLTSRTKISCRNSWDFIFGKNPVRIYAVEVILIKMYWDSSENCAEQNSCCLFNRPRRLLPWLTCPCSSSFAPHAGIVP